MKGNRHYYAMKKIFRSKLVRRESKIHVHNTSHFQLYYTATEPEAQRGKLHVFENKILRGIYSPVKDIDTQDWKSRKTRKYMSNRPLIVELANKRKMRWKIVMYHKQYRNQRLKHYSLKWIQRQAEAVQGKDESTINRMREKEREWCMMNSKLITGRRLPGIGSNGRKFLY